MYEFRKGMSKKVRFHPVTDERERWLRGEKEEVEDPRQEGKEARGDKEVGTLGNLEEKRTTQHKGQRGRKGGHGGTQGKGCWMCRTQRPWRTDALQFLEVVV